ERGFDDQSMAHRKQACLRSVAGLDLSVNVLHMAAGSLGRDEEALRDLFVRKSEGQKSKYLDLASGQAGGMPAPPPDTMAGRLEHGGHGITANPAAHHLGFQLRRSRFGRTGAPVGPGL